MLDEKFARAVCVRVRFFSSSYSTAKDVWERIFASSLTAIYDRRRQYFHFQVSAPGNEKGRTVQISLVSGGAALGGKILDRILALQLFANWQSFVRSSRWRKFSLLANDVYKVATNWNRSHWEQLGPSLTTFFAYMNTLLSRRGISSRQISN